MKFLGKYKSNVMKNILGIGIFRILGIVSNFVLLGLIYRYLANDELYGLWLTISSVLTFIFLFDFGIGNGLRNKLTEALNKKDNLLANKYISTAYIIMLFPTIFIVLVSIILTPYINWYNFFSFQTLDLGENYLTQIMLVVFILFSFQFYLTLLFAILHSLFKSYLISLIQFLIYVLNIIIIFVLYINNYSSLLILGIVYVSSSILLLLLFTLLILSREGLSVKLSFFDMSLVKPLFDIGLKFLILQFAIIILFNTDNILISKFVGVGEVPVYQLTYKLLSLYTMALAIILTPVWTLMIKYNDEKNHKGIVKSIKNVFVVFGVLIIGVIITALLTPFIISIWIGNNLNPNTSLITSVAVFVILHMWCNIFQSILNGLSKLRVQVAVYGIASAINIPISILLVQNTELGVLGIIFGTIISMLIPAVVLPVYTFNLLKK